MEVAIKKVGQREGSERFVLVNNRTRQVITVRDVSEKSLRRFFKARGIPEEAVAASLARARARYDEKPQRPPVSETAETMEAEDLLFQLGLEEDNSSAHQ